MTIPAYATIIEDQPPKPQGKRGRQSDHPINNSNNGDGLGMEEAIPNPPPRKSRSVIPANVENTLAQYYVMLGAGINALEIAKAQRTGTPIDHDLCGNAVIEQANACVEAWVKLAETNASVRKLLLKIAEGGALTAIIGAHFPIVMAMAINHGPGVLKSGLAFMGGETVDDDTVPDA